MSENCRIKHWIWWPYRPWRHARWWNMFNRSESSKPGMVFLMNVGKWMEADEIVSVWIMSYTLLKKKMDTCGLGVIFPLLSNWESIFNEGKQKKKNQWNKVVFEISILANLRSIFLIAFSTMYDKIIKSIYWEIGNIYVEW